MIKFEWFSDFACPYCWPVAKHVEKLLEEGKELEIEKCSMLLTPNIDKAGVATEEIMDIDSIHQTFEYLENKFPEYNIKFKRNPKSYRTERAHTVGYQIDNLEDAVKYSLEIFRLYFDENKNINDDQVIKEALDRLGLDSDKLLELADSQGHNYREDRKRTRDHGIKTIPTLVVDGQVQSNIKDYDDFKERLGL